MEALFFALTLSTLLVSGASPHTLTGTVARVVDGDTVHVVSGNVDTTIRLASIDAPEGKQEYGMQSTQLLRKLIDQRTVKVVIIEKDRYGRSVGTIWHEGKDINGEMVRLGAAWYLPDYHKSRKYELFHQSARKMRIGL